MYSVSPGDVFPEEFRHWLCADPRIGPLFEEMHADLLRADYWRELQTRIKNGHVEDVYAYRRKQRFSVRYGADSSRIRRLRRHPARCADLPDALRLSGLLKMPRWGIFFI